MVGKVLINSVVRRGANIPEDKLEFWPGVNILVGESNTGKTKWLETIDYILGDDVSAEARTEDDIFSLYDSALATLTVANENITIERRWKEAGGIGKVYLNGEPRSLKDYCDRLLNKLDIPSVHYPQGDPYGPRKWPELGWRSLMRHMYRREDFWNDIADKQPEVDQHACITQFLGAAEKLFSADYETYVSKSKRILELQAQKDQFMSILDQISAELVGASELGVALTPESLSAARQRLLNDGESLSARRQQFLEQVRAGVEKQTTAGQLADVNTISANLVKLEAEFEGVENALRKVHSRIEEVSTLTQLLSDELAKLARASEAGSVLADLRVTNCPACDQPITKTGVGEDRCYVCGRPTTQEQIQTATRRLLFEKEQVESEVEESKQVLERLEKERNALAARRQEMKEEMARIRMSLKPVRQVAAAVLPPELFLIDVEFGRIQEKAAQISRIEAVLAKRGTIAEEIVRIQKELAALDAAVQENASAVDFESLGDRLRDGFVTYFNEIVRLKQDSWIGQSVSVRLGERSFRIKVGESNWKTKLGGTQRLYFFLGYHYALLNLVKFEDSRYPGFLMLDFPAKVEDGTTVADKENFLLEPFVAMLKKAEFGGCQVIAAGRSFKDLKDVHRLEFSKTYKT